MEKYGIYVFNEEGKLIVDFNEEKANLIKKDINKISNEKHCLDKKFYFSKKIINNKAEKNPKNRNKINKILKKYR